MTDTVLTNSITFDQLRAGSEELADGLSIDELMMLKEDLSERDNTLDQDKELFNSIIARRFEVIASNVYAREGKDTGKLTISVDKEVNLEVSRSKTVVWDQDALAAMYGKIQQAGDNPDVYIQRVTSVAYKVSETAYQKWPDAIKKAFKPMRTVEAGETKFSLEKKVEKGSKK